jgi:hypothetical protein
MAFGQAHELFNNAGGSYFCVVSGVGNGLLQNSYSGGNTVRAVGYYYPDYNGQADLTAGGVITAGGKSVLFQRFKRNVNHDIWSNGVRVANQVPADFQYSWSASGPSIGVSTGQQRSLAVVIAAVWTRHLSDAEVLSLSRNPWQIFEPTSLHIALAYAAGAVTPDGIPTLSLAQLIDLLSTSARPRVTLSF